MNNRIFTIFLGLFFAGIIFWRAVLGALLFSVIPHQGSSRPPFWLDTGLSLLSILIASPIASWICRRFFGAVKPREWTESFPLQPEGTPNIDFELRYAKGWLWLPGAYAIITVLILLIFSGVLIPIEQQTGREAGIPLILFFGMGALIMGWLYSRPILRLDKNGISTWIAHLPWQEMNGFETHWGQDISGKSTLTSISFKTHQGKKWGFIYLALSPPEEREKLLDLLHSPLAKK